MPNQLAKNIRALRREQGLTQEQLAEAMDVSVGAVSKWEQASSMPEIPMLMKLADFFQTSVDALLGYELLNNGREESIQRLKEYLNTKTRWPSIPIRLTSSIRVPNCITWSAWKTGTNGGSKKPSNCIPAVFRS